MAKSRYTKAPEPPEEVKARFKMVLEVLSGMTTVSEAARRLGWSRNHFQDVMNRGVTGLLEGVTPKAPGPPPKSERETQLEEELHRLRRENSQLQERAEKVDRLLDLTSAVVRGQQSGRGRRAVSTPPKKTETKSDDEDPHGATARTLEHVEAMRAAGASADWAARAAGASASTARRWRARKNAGLKLCNQRGPGPRAPSEQHVHAAEEKLRDMRGLIGAAPLSRSIAGLSRRHAARVKEEVLMKLEAERVAEAMRVCVAAPGVVRGFDALFAPTTEGLRPVLVAADGAVPYRTSLTVAVDYDASAVAAALAADFELHGAPLVLRFDRAKAHDTPVVGAVLARWGVLALHGPPRCARYYGQLERQNREHRAWLISVGPLNATRLGDECRAMKVAFNEWLPRRRLAWKTAAQVWNERAELRIDRQELLEEVRERTQRLKESDDEVMRQAGAAQRFAIEAALTQRGLLTRQRGGWC